MFIVRYTASLSSFVSSLFFLVSSFFLLYGDGQHEMDLEKYFLAIRSVSERRESEHNICYSTSFTLSLLFFFCTGMADTRRFTATLQVIHSFGGRVERGRWTHIILDLSHSHIKLRQGKGVMIYSWFRGQLRHASAGLEGILGSLVGAIHLLSHVTPRPPAS